MMCSDGSTSCSYLVIIVCFFVKNRIPLFHSMLQSIFKRSMSLAKAGMGTGSREENAKKKERSIFDGDQQRSDPGFRQCPVSGEPPNRPVPAAAIVGLRDVIAIANLRDLPEAAIAPFESK
jgi:hypothetical protein